MASGETLVTFLPQHNEPPAANYMTLDLRNNHPVLDADATTDEEAVFSAILPRNYAGGGITATLYVAGSTATSGNIVFQAAFERIGVVQDMDADSFAAFNTSGAVAGTSGIPVAATITFTNGAQMGSVAAGELFRFKIRRDADDTSGTDNMTGDAEVRGIELKET